MIKYLFPYLFLSLPLLSFLLGLFFLLLWFHNFLLLRVKVHLNYLRLLNSYDVILSVSRINIYIIRIQIQCFKKCESGPGPYPIPYFYVVIQFNIFFLKCFKSKKLFITVINNGQNNMTSKFTIQPLRQTNFC